MTTARSMTTAGTGGDRLGPNRRHSRAAMSVPLPGTASPPNERNGSNSEEARHQVSGYEVRVCVCHREGPDVVRPDIYPGARR
jgi:hypothetical protein